MDSGQDMRKPSAVQASTKAGRVTVPGHLNDELPPGTWISILKQAGLKEDNQ
jgi:predicted RNA binding protein YcfA (HicA-like mRNA interferase family)